MWNREGQDPPLHIYKFQEIVDDILSFFRIILGEGEEGYIPIGIDFSVAGYQCLDDRADLAVVCLPDKF